MLDKLISISSEPISHDPPVFEEHLLTGIKPELVEELKQLLSEKNGFFAFESALHIYPASQGTDSINVNDWNQMPVWQERYGLGNTPILFFGQDLFMCQFALSNDGILRFKPEYGGRVQHASNLEEWATKIFQDYNYETGWELAHEWQVQNFPLGEHHRLLPKRPFIMGGEYECENLVAVDMIFGIRLLGNFYRQTASIPDGETVVVEWLIS